MHMSGGAHGIARWVLAVLCIAVLWLPAHGVGKRKADDAQLYVENDDDYVYPAAKQLLTESRYLRDAKEEDAKEEEEELDALVAFEESPTGDLNEMDTSTDNDAGGDSDDDSDDNPDKMTHAIHLQNEVMDMPLCKWFGNSLETKTAIYSMVTAHMAHENVKKQLENPIPHAVISLRHSMKSRLAVYVEDEEEGCFKARHLTANKWYHFKASYDGQFPFALEKSVLETQRYIRLRIDGMPAGLAWVLTPSLYLLKALDNMKPEDFTKPRNGEYLQNPEDANAVGNAKAIQQAIAQISETTALSQASEALNARDKPELDGSTAKMKVAVVRRVKQTVAAKKNKYRRRSNWKDRSRRLRKRSLNVDIGDEYASAMNGTTDGDVGGVRDSLHEPTFIAHRFTAANVADDNAEDDALHEAVGGNVRKQHHEHWELHFGDDGNQMTFTPHPSAGAARQRVQELVDIHTPRENNAAPTVADNDVQLHKRDLHTLAQDYARDFAEKQVRQVFDPKKIVDDKVRAIVVSTEDDDLIIQAISAVGRVVEMVVETVKQGFELVVELLGKLGIDLTRLVNWLRSVLNWQAMLNAISVANHMVRTLPGHSIRQLQSCDADFHHNIRKHKRGLQTTFSAYTERLSGNSQESIQEIRARIETEMKDGQQQNEGHSQSFLAGVIRRNIGSKSTHYLCSPGGGKGGGGSVNQDQVMQAIEMLMDRIGSVFRGKREQINTLVDKEQLKKGMVASALTKLLQGIEQMVMPFFDVAEEVNEVMFEQLVPVLEDLDKLINCRVDMPHLNKIWKYVMMQEAELTLGSLLVMPGSSVMAISYAAHNSEIAFDEADVEALVRRATTPDLMLLDWSICSNCRPRTVKKKQMILDTLMGFNKIYMDIILAVIGPLQQLLPFQPFAQFVHQMMSYRVQLPALPDGTSMGRPFNDASMATYLYGLVPLVFLQATSLSSMIAGALSKKIAKEVTAQMMEVFIRGPHIALATYEFAMDRQLDETPREYSLLRGWYLTLLALERGLETAPQLPGAAKLLQYELNAPALAFFVGWGRLQLLLAMKDEWM